MTATSEMVICRFVHITKGFKFVRTLCHVPRVGETLRFCNDLYYTVTEVVWCYDEDSLYERANIGIVELKEQS